MHLNNWVLVRSLKKKEINTFVLLIDIANVFKSDTLQEHVLESA